MPTLSRKTLSFTALASPVHAALTVAFATQSHALYRALAAGDLGAGVLLLLLGFAVAWGLRLQLALVLALCARLTSGTTLARRFAEAAVQSSPRVFRAGIVALAIGGATAGPSFGADLPAAVSPSAPETSPAWPTSPSTRVDPAESLTQSPGWPTTTPDAPRQKTPGEQRPSDPPHSPPPNDSPRSKTSTQARPSPSVYTVKAGDNLWKIARRHAATDTSSADLSRTVKKIYTHNRSVIGPDPNLILPGQRLELP